MEGVHERNLQKYRLDRKKFDGPFQVPTTKYEGKLIMLVHSERQRVSR